MISTPRGFIEKQIHFSETSVCSVAILDERAVPGQRYFEDVTAALPKMPLTRSLKTVRRFIRAVKADGYFQEGMSCST